MTILLDIPEVDEAVAEHASPVLGTRAPFNTPETDNSSYRARHSNTVDDIMPFSTMQDAFRATLGLVVLDRLWDNIGKADFRIACGSSVFKAHSVVMLGCSDLIVEELREMSAQGLSTDLFRVKPRHQQRLTANVHRDSFHRDEIEEMIYFAYHFKFSPKLLGKEYFERAMFMAQMHHVAVKFRASEVMQAMALAFEGFLERLKTKTSLQAAYFIQEITPVFKWIFMQPLHEVPGHIELQDVVTRYLNDHWDSIKDLIEFEYMLVDIPEMIPHFPLDAPILNED